MKFNTALRRWSNRRIERIEHVDVVVGIPSFNNDETISFVEDTISDGVAKYLPEKKALIIIADGGSTDDTREVALEKSIRPYVERLITIYRGIPGKGSAVRLIFEAARNLKAQAVAILDADLRSIKPEWIKNLLDPILKGEFHFVTPLYSRYKYDGTITNNIVYVLTRALFGKQIRQPIGGEFGFSLPLGKYLEQQDVWTTDVARYGIDIWLTINAIVNNFSLCQSYLGVKVHDTKDPSESLAAMFRQVVYTLFSLIEQYHDYWSKIEKSEPVPVFGEIEKIEPSPFSINLEKLIDNYKEGFDHFGVLWEKIVNPESFKYLKKLHNTQNSTFYIETEIWAKILYDFLVTFHTWKKDRYKLIEIMSPLYYAKVASFVNRTKDMNDLEAEEIVHQDAEIFEKNKPYLLTKWLSSESPSL